jgi:hypothetical protein
MTWSYRRVRQPLVIPVIFVQKNEDLCFCANYRKLNDVTRKYCFPLPRTDNTLNTLAGGQMVLHCEPEEQLYLNRRRRLFLTG